MLNIFSPNMLKTFEECPQKFFFKYIEKISLPQRSTIFEKGKKIHALANYYLNSENIAKMEKVLTADEKIIWEALKSNKYFKLNVFNTEYNLSCKVDKYWIGGRLDALVYEAKCQLQDTERRQEGKKAGGQASHLSPLTSHYYILDYKTGYLPKDAEQDFQTIIYLLCADKFLKSKNSYSSLRFIYLGLKEGKEKEIVLNEDLKKQYEDRIIQTCKKIELALNSGNLPPLINCKNNCEYCKICDTELQLSPTKTSC